MVARTKAKMDVSVQQTLSQLTTTPRYSVLRSDHDVEIRLPRAKQARYISQQSFVRLPTDSNGYLKLTVAIQFP